MKATALVVGVVLLTALPLRPGETPPPSPNRNDTPSSSLSLTPPAPEPPAATVRVGDTAPDVSFQTADGASRRLDDLLRQGHVLLVFSPGEDGLRALQHERGALLDLGVVPVAVLDQRVGATRGLQRRLGLSLVLVPDSRRVVAGQFNVVDDVRQRVAPSWFMIERSGRVRGLRRNQIPAAEWARLAATVLGMPAHDVAVPAADR